MQTYRSYGKINLYLDIVGRRPDGFHDIETLFQTVSLYDELRVDILPAELELHCEAAELAEPTDNLVYRAAALLRRHTGTTVGARMALTKNIPVAAGMAGGSGDAAAALVALNALWELGLGHAELAKLALQLGSDVPYCLTGGTAVATGRGERIEAVAPIPETWFVLVHPPIGISAGAVYNHPALRHTAETPVNGRTSAFAHAIDSVQNGRIAESLFNRMEEPVFVMHPEMKQYKQDLLDAGCSAALMSGSGSTLFGLAHGPSHAQEIAAALAQHRTSIVHTVTHGVQQYQSVINRC